MMVRKVTKKEKQMPGVPEVATGETLPARFPEGVDPPAVVRELLERVTAAAQKAASALRQPPAGLSPEHMEMLRRGVQQAVSQIRLEWTHLSAVADTMWKAGVLSEETYRGMRRALAALKAQL
jgi:hypothetical protein